MKAIFLDRDGVINKYPGDTEYVKSWEEFHFLPDTKNALKKFNENGYKVFIISNQAGVSRGGYSKKELDLITENMLNELEKEDIHISGVFYCIHLPQDNCSCRKPGTGLIRQAQAAAEKQGEAIEFSKSFFVGDTIRDVETGKAAGLRTILVFSGKEKPENKSSWQYLPDFTCRNLLEAAELILSK